MIKLMKYFSKLEWLQFFAVIVLVVGTVAIDMQLPDLMADIMSLIGTENATSEIFKTGGIMLALCFASAGATALAGFFSAHIAAGLCKTVRGKLFDKVGNFSMQEINKFSTASLITRCTNDITQLQQTYAIGLRLVFTAPIMAIWAIFKIVGKSSSLSLVTAIFLVVMVAGIMAIFLFAFPKFSSMQKKVDKLNLVTRENLTGLKVVRAYNAEEKQTEKFEKANIDLAKTNTFLNSLMALLSPFMTIVMSGLSLALVWIGASLIGQNLLNVPDLMAFTQYASQVLTSFVILSMLFLVLPRAEVSARRVREVLNSQNVIKDGTEELAGEIKGQVEFKNVSFSYPNSKENVLEDISFKIEKGQTLAIVGSTGSGKSTIINLLMRFYDATSGEILVDGVPIKNLKMESLYQKIGYVPQKSTLMSGTIKENVGYGVENLSQEDLQNALKISQSSEFVSRLEDKEEHFISRGGGNVSGGQKQRLSIARALAKNPEFLLFDDSFSALDFATDKKLRKGLQGSSATKIIVAQRIGTVRDADKILVLGDGKILGCGTHKTLLKKCKVYRELALSQLSKEEL